MDTAAPNVVGASTMSASRSIVGGNIDVVPLSVGDPTSHRGTKVGRSGKLPAYSRDAVGSDIGGRVDASERRALFPLSPKTTTCISRLPQIRTHSDTSWEAERHGASRASCCICDATKVATAALGCACSQAACDISDVCTLSLMVMIKWLALSQAIQHFLMGSLTIVIGGSDRTLGTATRFTY